MVDVVAKRIKKQMISEADAITELIETNLAKLNEFTIFPLECSCCNQLKFFKGVDLENHIA